MALHVKGNRILTEEEKNKEEMSEDVGGGILLIIAVLFLLSPGIILTSLINPFFNFTTSQLWGSAIVGTIVVMIIMYFTIGISVSRYLICAGICGGFIIVLTLFNSDNIFWNTTKAMFDTDSDDKTETIKDDTSQYNRTYQMMAQNLCVASIDKD
jgi:hypothetical protein